MFLDKLTTELAVRVVYASIGPTAVEQTNLLADQANSSMVVDLPAILFGGSIRMQQIKIPKLQVKGCGVRVHTVGISLAAFRASPEATAALERSALLTDALVFVVEPEQSDLRAAYDDARSHPLGDLRTAVIAPAECDVTGLLGTGADVPVASGRRAAMDALQAVMKPMMLELARQFG